MADFNTPATMERARELLAAEYESIGDTLNAGAIRHGHYVCEEVDIALRAITAALSAPLSPRPDLAGLVEQIALDMEYAVAGGMSWISHSECYEFTRRLRALRLPADPPAQSAPDDTDELAAFLEASMLANDALCSIDSLARAVAQDLLSRYAAPPAQPAPVGDERYSELIMAVSAKFPGETRHETALRYIQNAERPSEASARAQQSSADPPTPIVRD